MMPPHSVISGRYTDSRYTAGKNKQHTVETVHDPAVTGHDGAVILDAILPFQHRSGQVPEDTEHRQYRRDERDAQIVCLHRTAKYLSSCHRKEAGENKHSHQRGVHAPTAPSTVFFGLISGASLCLPHQCPGKVGTGIRHPGGHQ